MLGRDIPGCWDVCLMPHPPPHICVCPCNRSLQPLYLHYFYNAALRNYFTNLHKEGGVALPPHRLRGPTTPNLAHAPPWHLLAAPAPVGSSIKWSSWSLTMGHRKQGVVHHPLRTPTPAVIITV